MRLSIEHTTIYRYDEPAHRVIQAFRLWPAPCGDQIVRRWEVRIEDRLLKSTCTDGFGNPAATHTFDDPIESVRILVRGEVDTSDNNGILGGTLEPLPTRFFLVPTPLTATDDALAVLADEVPAAEDGDVARLHRLCNLVRDRIDYVPEQTDAATTASESLASGKGVCQDHAHVLIACARLMGYPARYVSGYLSAGADGGEAASHAWAEVFLDDLGWVGFDAANRICPNEHYVRMATGRDYWDAAPVRGLRQGGVTEHLEVKVRIEESKTPRAQNSQSQNSQSQSAQ